MAIAFRSKGTTVAVDTSASGTGVVPVPYPAGHVSGDTLLLFVTTDDNSNVGDLGGWTRLFYITNGTSLASPYTPRLRTKCFVRQDTGALGSTLNLQADTNPWPGGKPSVLAYMVAYSGCEPTGPIERWDFFSTLNTNVAQAHPIETTLSANAWLLTFRATSSDAPGATFTVAGGTNTERQDDFDTIPELASALYDAGPLTAGAQTQRTTTASRAATYGGLAVSLVLKPSGAVSSTPSAGAVDALATAYDATVTAQNGDWSLCAADGLPVYRMAIDWAGDGSLTDPDGLGATYVSDTFSRTASSGWGSTETPNQAWTVTGGPSSDYSVTPGVGRHAVSTRNVSRYSLTASPSADTDTRITFSSDQVALTDTFLLNLLARETTTSDYYSARAELGTDSSITLSLRKTTTALGDVALGSVAPGLTYAIGTRFTLRLRVQGSSLYAKVWDATLAEPDAWQLTATDTDLTAAGNLGVRTLIRTATTNTLPVTISWDDLTASAPADSDEATPDIVGDTSITYGRDQNRQLNPASVGAASFSVINVDRKYSPDYSGSLLFGDLEPAQRMVATVDYGGHTYPLTYAKVDDYNLTADMTQRSVDFTFLDGLADLQNFDLSTGVYRSKRTGELIQVILELAGWTGPTDIDLGATIVPFWWVEGTDALTAITDLIKSEGPPSIAYQAPDGTFVFRDRHHRLLRAESLNVQADFSQSKLMDCTTPASGPDDDTFDFTAPFTYQHGWRDIVNSVSFEVQERLEDSDLTAIWTQEDQIPISNGQSITIEISGSDPFLEAVTPVSGTDFQVTGSGLVVATLSRDSGQSATLTLLASGGAVNVSSLQVRAKAISVQRTVKISRVDADSITRHGTKSYGEEAPWANKNDADAIAGMILLQYARRRPTVQVRITSEDPAHFVQVITRTVSDRIHLTYGEVGLDDDFFVESVQHTITRMNQSGQPPVHSVVLGCEKDFDLVENPFTFDQRGSGFDQGVFDPIQSDQPDTVFLFDDPDQGLFDVGKYGT